MTGPENALTAGEWSLLERLARGDSIDAEREWHTLVALADRGLVELDPTHGREPTPARVTPAGRQALRPLAS